MLHIEALHRVAYRIYNTREPIFNPRSAVLKTLIAERTAFLVIDESVKKRYGDEIRSFLSGAPNVTGTLVLPGQESAKSWRSVEVVCESLLEAGLDRRGVVVGIGGGIVLDVAGFAASVFRRGVSYVRVPTTLIGMVDVAVGIKHGVNFCNRKNLLGSFFPSDAAVVDASFLRTLGRRHVAGGLAEIVKIALVADAHLFGLVETDPGTLCLSRFTRPLLVGTEIIRAAQRAMIDELEPNLYEEDLQRLADFGHAFSPALEVAAEFTLTHGEAVAIDMLISTAIAVRRGLCEADVYARLRAVCCAAGLPVTHPVVTPALLSAALRETRAQRGNRLNLVVPTRIGHGAFVQDVTEADLAEACSLLRVK